MTVIYSLQEMNTKLIHISKMIIYVIFCLASNIICIQKKKKEESYIYKWLLVFNMLLIEIERKK